MVYSPLHWLHSFEPSPILAHLGSLTIYWYGSLYFIAILFGYLLVRSFLRSQIKSSEDSIHSSYAVQLIPRLPDVGVGLIVSGLVGARLYHVLNALPYYWEFPSKIFAIWEGGLAIHGALIFGALYLWLFARTLKPRDPKTALLFLTDLLAPAVLLGQAIGRWGNYFNQELFGYPTSLPWGIPIEPQNRPTIFFEFTHFHPAFLYESLWDLAGFLLLLVLTRRNKMRLGSITLLYLVIMSSGRLIAEMFRVDDTPIIATLRLPFLVSATVLIAAVLIYLRQRIPKKV